VIRHEARRGYGASLLTGIRAASADRIVLLDADETYPCEDIPSLIERPVADGVAVGGGGRCPT
jgi:glycosyltransferase involved in cell wall biosynthesis